MIDASLTIKGLQELNDLNVRAINALKPETSLGRAVKFVTEMTHSYIVKITHVDTGAYRASHRMAVQMNAGRGQVYVDQAARNPRTTKLVRDYAEVEEARGGSHAAYTRTQAEMGQKALDRGVAYIKGQLPI